MIADADPAGLDAVASRWSTVHDALRSAQADLLRHTLAATDHWSGTAADAFAAHADKLHRALGNGAAYAFNASSGVSCAADALRSAKASMPAESSPQELLAQCTATNTCDAPSPLLEARRREAAGVIERLQERYDAAAEMIGYPTQEGVATDRGLFHDGPSSLLKTSTRARQSTIASSTTHSAGLLPRTAEGPPDALGQARALGWESSPHLDGSTSTPEASAGAQLYGEGSPSHRYEAAPLPASERMGPTLTSWHGDEWLTHGGSRELDTSAHPAQQQVPLGGTEAPPDELSSREVLTSREPAKAAASGFASRRPPMFIAEEHGSAPGDLHSDRSAPPGNEGAATYREQTASTLTPMAAGSAMRLSGRARRKRPGYLVELEEAWAVEAEGNPPVIE